MNKREEASIHCESGIITVILQWAQPGIVCLLEENKRREQENPSLQKVATIGFFDAANAVVNSFVGVAGGTRPGVNASGCGRQQASLKVEKISIFLAHKQPVRDTKILHDHFMNVL